MFVARDIRSDDLAGMFEGADAVVHLAWWFGCPVGRNVVIDGST
jgi:hypothetical protein